MTKNITNTEERVRTNPALGMLMALPGGIEASERRGQEELVANDEFLPFDKQGGAAAFEALGFSFGALKEGDSLFQHATLPVGWTRKATDHAMWSDIVDERGLRRVGIFYKAAFYDRAAHMYVVRVGADIAQRAVYGDAEITMETLQLGMLTRAERDDFRSWLVGMRANITESPTIYGKYETRVMACEATVDAYDG